MVLVVDDDVLVVEVVRKWLEREGYRVETCQNGQEAFGKLRAADCQCMLLDIRMPLINGVELLLLMQSEGIRVPTIVIAGFKDFDEKEMKSFANVVAFLPKPMDMKRLMETVAKYAKPAPR